MRWMPGAAHVGSGDQSEGWRQSRRHAAHVDAAVPGERADYCRQEEAFSVEAALKAPLRRASTCGPGRLRTRTDRSERTFMRALCVVLSLLLATAVVAAGPKF